MRSREERVTRVAKKSQISDCVRRYLDIHDFGREIRNGILYFWSVLTFLKEEPYWSRNLTFRFKRLLREKCGEKVYMRRKRWR